MSIDEQIERCREKLRDARLREREAEYSAGVWQRAIAKLEASRDKS